MIYKKAWLFKQKFMSSTKKEWDESEYKRTSKQVAVDACVVYGVI